MTGDLRECPFCGKPGHQTSAQAPTGPTWYWACCTDSECTGWHSKPHLVADAAVAAWNTRAAAPDLARLRAVATEMREALGAYDAQMAIIGSCSDGYCVVQKPVGMHTNGGCKCMWDRMKAQRLGRAAQMLADATRTALANAKEAGL